MKLSFLLGGAAGYVLGAKAGHDRYEAIVRVARRAAGSQTVQSTAGVLQARVDLLAHQVRDLVAARRPDGSTTRSAGHSGNGHGVYGPGPDGHRISTDRA